MALFGYVVVQVKTKKLTSEWFSTFDYLSNPNVTLFYDWHVGLNLDYFFFASAKSMFNLRINE